VRDVPLVDGNRATTSDVTAQVVGMHSNTGFIPGLQKTGNLVDTFSSPKEVMAYLLIIELAPLEVRSFCHLPVRRRSEAIFDFRQVRSTMITLVPNRGGGQHRASEGSCHMRLMTTFVHSEEPHEHLLWSSHGSSLCTAPPGNPKLEQGGAPLQFSLADRSDNEMLLVLTWL